MKSRFLYEGKKVVIHTHDENEYISKIINTTFRLLEPLGYKVKPFVKEHWEVFEYA